jgi:AraC-like DNA-binding protein
MRGNGPSGVVQQERVVPDGCIDIIFVRRSPTADYRVSVVGTMTAPVFEALADYVDYIGIRFAPGGFMHFFDMPPDQLTDRVVLFESLSSSSMPAEQMAENDNIQARLRILEDDLNWRLTSERQDPILTSLLEIISLSRGNVPMRQLADAANWSPRHLRRAFRESVGVSPKTFCRITRFKNALRALRHSLQPDLLTVALDAGYYDQAHFIHDFNHLYGSSPSIVLKDRDS